MDTDYYPFGLTFNSYARENSVPNMYQYNGKEKQDELDLGWLDYGARMYMPEIGRWGVVDPLAAKYLSLSPYNYVGNIPTILIDPDGKRIEWGENVTREERRMIKKALRQHASSSTYKNLYKELKKTDNRYIVKTYRNDDLDHGGKVGASFEGNYTHYTSNEMESGRTEVIPNQNAATKDDFAEDEKGGIISLNTYWVDMSSKKDIADYIVEELVHASQYEHAAKNNGDTSGGTANTEFEAKAIVGQIKSESRRKMSLDPGDAPAHAFGQQAFKSKSINGWENALRTWHGSSGYSNRPITNRKPELLKKLIK